MKRALAFTLMVLAIMIIAVSCEEPQAPHEHTYAEEWSHDDTFHWHASACGHEEEVSDKEEHKWKEGGDENGWIVDEDSTEEKTGTKHRICSVCKYEEKGTVPLKGHVHTFSAYDHTADKHWRTCTGCGEKFTYTHTFSYVDAGASGHYEKCYCEYSKSTVAHVYTDKKVLKNDSKIYKICDLCGNSDTKAPTDKTSGVVAASGTGELSSENSEEGTVTVKENGKDVTKEVKINTKDVEIEVAATAETKTNTTNKTTVTFPSGALKADKDATSVSLIVETADISAASANDSGYQITTSGSEANTEAVVAGFEFNLLNAVASNLTGKDSDGNVAGVTVKTYIAPGLTTYDINSYDERNTLKIVYVGNDAGETPKITKYITKTGELEYTVYHFSRYAIISTNMIATDNLGTMYSDLSTALSALGTKNVNKDIEKITLLKNIEVSSKISFSNKGTIDLNGKTITFEGAEITNAIENSGTLTLTNGTIKYVNGRNSEGNYSIIVNSRTLNTSKLIVDAYVAATCCVNFDSADAAIKADNLCTEAFVVRNSGTATFDSSKLNLTVKLANEAELYDDKQFAGVRPIAIYQTNGAKTEITNDSTLKVTTEVPGGAMGLFVMLSSDASNAEQEPSAKISDSSIIVSNSCLGYTSAVFAESMTSEKQARIDIEGSSTISSTDTFDISQFNDIGDLGLTDYQNYVYGLRAKGNAVINITNSTDVSVTGDKAVKVQYACEESNHDGTAKTNKICGQIINTDTKTWYVNTAESLAAAVENAEGERKILLTENIAPTNDITVNKGQKITLDLGDKKIKFEDKRFVISAYNASGDTSKGGSLIIEGNGSIEKDLTKANSTVRSLFRLEGNSDSTKTVAANLTIGKNVELEGPCAIWIPSVNSKCFDITIDIYGKVKGLEPILVNGGNKNVGTNEKIEAEDRAAKINIYDGAVITGTGDEDLIYLPGYAKTTIGKATLTAYEGRNAIVIGGGELTINGATIESGNTQSTSTGVTGGMDTKNCSAVYVNQNSGSHYLDVTINDGTFTGFIPFYQDEGRNTPDATKVTLTITGGTFTATGEGDDSASIKSINKERFITGGTFSTQPDSKYIATGYTAVKNETVWNVVKTTT